MAEEGRDFRSRLAEGATFQRVGTGETYRLVAAPAFEPSEARAEELVRRCNEPAVYDALFRRRLEGRAYGRRDAVSFLAWARRQWAAGRHFVFFSVSPGDELAGTVDIKAPPPRARLAEPPLRPSDLPAEVGFWASAEHRGTGSAAMEALCGVAERAGYHALVAQAASDNERSFAALERCGFLDYPRARSSLECGRGFYKLLLCEPSPLAAAALSAAVPSGGSGGAAAAAVAAAAAATPDGVDAADAEGWTALQRAVVAGNANAVRLLVRELGASPDAVCVLTFRQKVSVFGGLAPVDRLATCAMGGSPAWLAAACGHTDVLRFLVEEAGANPEASSAGGSAVQAAAWGGQMETLRYLVEDRGANVNAKSAIGWTPLHSAAYAGRVDAAAYLASRGASPLARGAHDETPLFEACIYSPAVADHFISECDALSTLPDASLGSLAHVASCSGSVALVRRLVSACPRELPLSLLFTSMECAAEHGHADMLAYLARRDPVQRLLQAGTFPDRMGNVLATAAQNGHIEAVGVVAKAAAEAGHPVDLATLMLPDGVACIEGAAAMGDTRMVRYLVERHGVPPDGTRTDTRITPLLLAANQDDSHRHRDVLPCVRYLARRSSPETLSGTLSQRMPFKPSLETPLYLLREAGARASTAAVAKAVVDGLPTLVDEMMCHPNDVDPRMLIIRAAGAVNRCSPNRHERVHQAATAALDWGAGKHRIQRRRAIAHDFLYGTAPAPGPLPVADLCALVGQFLHA